MPFKLPFTKSRQYNVISSSVLVVSVSLLDGSSLECTLSADCTGQHCLENVAARIGLKQFEYFGLRYMCKRPYPKVRWVELDRPLKKQLDKYAQSPALTFSVLYYIHDVGLLRNDVTLSYFYLQVKQDVLEGKLRCNYEQAVLLASYSLQAEYGDHQPDRHTPEYLKEFVVLPKLPSLSETEVTVLLELAVCQYASLRGLSQNLAETYYILDAQRLEGYGQETFMARDERGSEVYLGASLVGVTIRPASGHTLTTLRWNDISNLVNLKRAFAIECPKNGRTFQFTFDEPDAAKYIWKMCVKQHTFFKRNQNLLENDAVDGNPGGGMSGTIPGGPEDITYLQNNSANSNQGRGGSSTSSSVTSIQQQQSQAVAHTNSFSVRGVTIPDLQRSVMNASDLQIDRDNMNYQAFVRMREQQPNNTTAYQQQQYLPPTRVRSDGHQMHDHVARSVLSIPSHIPSNTGTNGLAMQQQQQQQQQQSQYPAGNCMSANSTCNLYQPSNIQPSSNNVVRYTIPLNDTTLDASAVRIHCMDATTSNTANNPNPLSASYQQESGYKHQSEGLASQAEINTQSHQTLVPCNSNPNLSTVTNFSNSFRRAMLPDYRAAPDYNSIMSHRQQVGGGMLMSKGGFPLHNTYSTPDLQSAVSLDPHAKNLHEYARPPPPPYPGAVGGHRPGLLYPKSSSTSSPDLVGAGYSQLANSCSHLSQLQHQQHNRNTAYSKGLSRTYENLCDLDDVVVSLRHHMNGQDGNNPQFLHSFPSVNGLQSTPSLDCLTDGPSVYHLSGNNPEQESSEPIYQNVVSYSQQTPHIQYYQEQLQKQQQLLEHQELLQRKGSNPADNTNNVINVSSPPKKAERKKWAVVMPENNGLPLVTANMNLQPHTMMIKTNDGLVQNVPSSSKSGSLSNSVNPLSCSVNLVTTSVNPLSNSVDSTKSSPLINMSTYTDPYLATSTSGVLRPTESLGALHSNMAENSSSIPNTNTVINVTNSSINNDGVNGVLNLSNTSSHAGINENSNISAEDKQLRKVSGNVTQISVNLPESHSTKTLTEEVKLQSSNSVTNHSGAVKETSISQNNSSVLKANSKAEILNNGGQFNSSLNDSTASSSGMRSPHHDSVTLSRIYAARDPRARQLQNELLSAELPLKFKSIPLAKINPIYANSNVSSNNITLPYVGNKVTLQPSSGNSDGYINASHITASMGSSRQVFYIVQSLSIESPASQIWQCVWEQDVRLIVTMATCLGGSKVDDTTAKPSKASKLLASFSKRRGKKKEALQQKEEESSNTKASQEDLTDELSSGSCFPYWPQFDNTSIECGPYRIYRRDSTVCDSYTISRLHMKTNKSNSRTVWHINYTHGLTNARSFIEMIEQLSSLREVSQQEASDEATTPGINVNTPVLLQCPSGTEHCGAVIVSDLMIGGACNAASSQSREGTLRGGTLGGSAIYDAVVIENSYSTMSDGAVMDPSKILPHLRQQRANLVPTLMIFKFIYKVMIEYFGRSRLI